MGGPGCSDEAADDHHVVGQNEECLATTRAAGGVADGVGVPALCLHYGTATLRLSVRSPTSDSGADVLDSLASSSNRGYIADMPDDPRRPQEWVLMTYRLPREPSAPRLALWRKLKQLGVAQLADGLVALPTDARTREQLEWAAESVEEAGGTAGVWFARPATRELERLIIEPMNAARGAEYAMIITQVGAARSMEAPQRRQVLRKLRRQMRQVQRRDFFRPPQHDQAQELLRDLSDAAMHIHDEKEILP